MGRGSLQSCLGSARLLDQTTHQRAPKIQHNSSQGFLRLLCFAVFWLLIPGKSQKTNTSCMLNNPLSQLSSLITNYSGNPSLGTSTGQQTEKLGYIPISFPNCTPTPFYCLTNQYRGRKHHRLEKTVTPLISLINYCFLESELTVFGQTGGQRG